MKRLALLLSLLVSVSSPLFGTAFFQEGFENGLDYRWNRNSSGQLYQYNSNTGAITSALKFSGSKSHEAKLFKNSGKNRCELFYDGKRPDWVQTLIGQTRTWGFAIYIPTTWQHDTANGQFDIVHQVFSPADPLDPVRSPVLTLSIYGNSASSSRWSITNRFQNKTNGNYGSRNWSQSTLGNVPLGRWVRWVFQCKFTPDPAGAGFLKVWQDGTLVINQSNILTSYNDAGSLWFKYGVYKYIDTSSVTSRYVYHDNIRISNASGTTGYNEASP